MTTQDSTRRVSSLPSPETESPSPKGPHSHQQTLADRPGDEEGVGEQRHGGPAAGSRLPKGTCEVTKCSQGKGDLGCSLPGCEPQRGREERLGLQGDGGGGAGGSPCKRGHHSDEVTLESGGP